MLILNHIFSWFCIHCVEKKLNFGSNPLVGDIIIVTEVFHALQFNLWKYYLEGYDLPPLKVVGYEGIFGFCTTLYFLWPMYFISVGETFGLGPEFQVWRCYWWFDTVWNRSRNHEMDFWQYVLIAMFNFLQVFCN